MATLDLLAWQPAPTTGGPRPRDRDLAPVTASPSDRFEAWRTRQPEIVAWILARATEAATAGERVSAKALVEAARAQFRTPINNTVTAPLGAWLAAQSPALAACIERRERKRP